jgi:hypothetical protein
MVTVFFPVERQSIWSRWLRKCKVHCPDMFTVILCWYVHCHIVLICSLSYCADMFIVILCWYVHCHIVLICSLPYCVDMFIVILCWYVHYHIVLICSLPYCADMFTTILCWYVHCHIVLICSLSFLFQLCSGNSSRYFTFLKTFHICNPIFFEKKWSP